MSTNLSHPRVGLLGFGAIGSLIGRALSPHVRILVHDTGEQARAQAAAEGFDCGTLEAVAACDIVVLAVPVKVLADSLRAIRRYVRPGSVVIDVCSIKETPARLMRELLPADVEILGTHPMFGPRSTGAGLAGAKIVICPLRGTRWRRIAAHLRHGLGLKVIRTTPEDHDRQAALSQGLTHLLARAVSQLGAAPEIRTRSFDLLMEALAMVRDDAPEVFEAVTKGNPHVAEVRRQLLQSLES